MTEAVEIAQGLARKILESCLEHRDPVPPRLAALAGDKPVVCRPRLAMVAD